MSKKAWAVVLGLVSSAACAVAAFSCGTADLPPTQPPQDAEAEAEAGTRPPPVPQRDTGVAAPIDAQIDYDANPSDGQVPFPGEWRPVPGMPASCAARIAVDPKVSVSRFPWKACPSGREDCKLFVADWAPADRFTFSPLPVAPFFEDARGVHITYSRTFRKDPPYKVSALQLLDGDAELAIYGHIADADTTCTITQLAASAAGVGLVMSQRLAIYESFAGQSTLSDPSNLTVSRITPSLGSSPLIQGMAHGQGFVAFEQTSFSLGIYASAYRFSDQTLVTSTPANNLASERPVPSVGGYFALVAASPSYAAFMPLEGGYRPVIRPLPGNRVVYVGIDHTNAEALVWIEEGGAAPTLFTSPFTTTEAGLVRRAVARITSTTGVVNAGTFVAGFGEYSAVRVVRLSDGLGWAVPAETSAPMLGGAWVNADYVWALISHTLPGTPGFPVRGGVIRIKRAPLGAPTVPSGL